MRIPCREAKTWITPNEWGQSVSKAAAEFGMGLVTDTAPWTRVARFLDGGGGGRKLFPRLPLSFLADSGDVYTFNSVNYYLLFSDLWPNVTC